MVTFETIWAGFGLNSRGALAGPGRGKWTERGGGGRGRRWEGEGGGRMRERWGVGGVGRGARNGYVRGEKAICTTTLCILQCTVLCYSTQYNGVLYCIVLYSIQYTRVLIDYRWRNVNV